MRNVLLARVDDRLIHGEVVTSFIPYYHADHVMIVDDTVANDKFNRRVLEMVAPKGVKVEIYTLEEGVEALKRDPDEGEKLILLTKTPITFEKLIDAGIEIPAINIGGMGVRGSRKPFVRNCQADAEEVASMKRMYAKGIDIYYKLVAEQNRIELKDQLS